METENILTSLSKRLKDKFGTETPSMEMEAILLALTKLEKSLKDIDSAKKQVDNVIKSTEGLTAVIEKYKSIFGNLSSDVRSVVSGIKAMLSEWSERNQEITEMLAEQTERLQIETTRLVNFDFNKSFENLQKKTVEQFEKDLADKLTIIDDKAAVLQEAAEKFGTQIKRLASIDLEKHFDKHQKTLSEIFTAVNAINITLSGLTQALNSITQSTVGIQRTLEENTAKTESLLSDFQNGVSAAISSIEKKTAVRFSLMEEKFMATASLQTELLKNNIKTSRRVYFVSLGMMFCMIVLIISVIFLKFA